MALYTRLASVMRQGAHKAVIFVDDEGHITAFIGWDGVHLEAMCTVFGRFSAWIWLLIDTMILA